MNPDTTIKRMSSRDFFRNPAAAKNEAKNAPLIINEYGEVAFVFLPFAQYKALLRDNADLVPLPAPIETEENPEKVSASAEMAILSDKLSDSFIGLHERIYLISTNIGKVMEATDNIQYDLTAIHENGITATKSPDATNISESLPQNPQNVIDAIRAYNHEVLAEIDQLTSEVKEKLQQRYLHAPKRLAKWLWLLAVVALVALVATGIASLLTWWQMQRAATFHAQAEDAKAAGAVITHCAPAKGNAQVRCVLVKTGMSWKGESGKTAYMEIAR